MYKWAVRRQIRRNIDALGRGDPAPLLRGYADDAVLVFPGASTWGGEHRGRPAIERFLRRFLAAGLSGRSEDILVNGPPWRTRIAVVFVDRASDADGTEVYANRAVLHAVARLGSDHAARGLRGHGEGGDVRPLAARARRRAGMTGDAQSSPNAQPRPPTRCCR